MPENVFTNNQYHKKVMTMPSFFYDYLRISKCIAMTHDDVHIDKDSSLLVIFIKSSNKCNKNLFEDETRK